MTQNISVPQQNQIVITPEELYRQYGEATIQLKLANQKVMILEQSINQLLGQMPPK